MKLSIILSATLISFGLSSAAQQSAPDWDFQGKYLIAISDADMLASAYENGKLGPRYGEDQLAVIPLNTTPDKYQAYTVGATNSVAGPPSIVDVTPDGSFAYVIETFSPRPGESDAETFADLKLGNTLSVINLTNPEKPINIQEVKIEDRPLSVNVNQEGSLLAISYHSLEGNAKSPISIHRIKKDGTVEGNFTPTIEGWDNTNDLVDLVWHPLQNILALLNQHKNTVQFVRVNTSDGDIALEKWGNTVSIGKYPMIGRFSEDGEHFLANNLYWGSDVFNTWTEAPNGTVVNIALNHMQQDGQPVHSLTSQVMVGPSPEGFAISKDGRYVAAVNMERSWLPYDDERQTWHSSITLIERDPETGAMNVMNTIPYYAVLPEMAVFDASSNYLAVVAFDHYDHSKSGGALDFFKIVNDPLNKERKTLVQTRYSVPLQHGSHDLILVD